MGNILTVATSSLTQAQAALSEIQKATPCFVHLVLSYPSDLLERTGEFTKSQANIDELLEGKAKELTGKDLDQKLIDDPTGPVAQVVNHLLSQAVTNGASDIHFEPLAQTLRIRYREDGILQEVKTFDRLFSTPFAAAIKVMAGLDVAETRIPQDGAIHQSIAGRKIDFRVATYPTDNGEKIVLRILDSSKDWISLDALMIADSEKQKLIHAIENPQGLILCTGPTGSGKTSTLYAVLKHLNTPKRNILTIEDPIEYRIGGISQAQINTKKGFTFATGLRSMLRLDPNVILVGEMRDLETAEIGVQASLTGHLVLSTVHANSSTQTVARLIDMGVEKFLVGSALSAVISQRLIRKICDKCRVGYPPSADELKGIGYQGPPLKHLYRGKGCNHCRGEGYRGRVPVMEILIIHNVMRPIISKHADPGLLFQEARKHGLKTIQEAGLEKVLGGITTAQEMTRVLGRVG